MYMFDRAYVSADANLTGLASNVTGASWTLSANSAGDDTAHKITIRNDSGNDHSGKTGLITGTSPNGQPQTETLALPAGSATVTSTKYFATVTSVVPSATIDADTMDIGWAAAAVTPWVSLRGSTDFKVGFGVTVDSGSPNYTVQHSFASGGAFDHASVAGKTATASGEYLSPIQALRVVLTAAGGVTLHLMQTGA
jgi:hypothetical protein